MRDISPEDRIAQLSQARDAAQAVVDEITRRDTKDPIPSRIERRRPNLLRARGQVRDLNRIIDNEEAATKVVTVDEGDVDRLIALAKKLDKAIAGSAFAVSGIGAITSILNAVAAVRDTLA
jgi:hypothetical protein